MKSTTVIKSFGLLLFIVGFGLFNAFFFMSDFRLTEDILQENLTDESTYESMQASATDMIGKTYAYNLPFLKDLDGVMEEANQKIAAKYGIAEEEINQIVAPYEGKENISFSVENAKVVLGGDEDVSSFKQKIFEDYTSWMEGQTFDNTTALKNQLTKTVANINNDVSGKKGLTNMKLMT
jgi:hypothetical protein